MAAQQLVLLHSPLVGPSTWRPVADEFRSRGRRVVVPSLADALDDGPPYYAACAERVAAALRGGQAERAVLVVHSGAGALVPAVVPVAPVVIDTVAFVDATLPYPGRAWFDTVLSGMARELRGLADDGRLPPWHEWFPPELLGRLLPDEEVRAAFAADVPRLPLAYFAEKAPADDRWERAAAGYLQLSATYDDAATEAGRRGWPVVRYEGHHLSPVVEPIAVADALTELLDALA
jgi:hypothetical protein